MQLCAGKASKVIESFIVMESNVGYKMARELLDDRFDNTLL